MLSFTNKNDERFTFFIASRRTALWLLVYSLYLNAQRQHNALNKTLVGLVVSHKEITCSSSNQDQMGSLNLQEKEKCHPQPFKLTNDCKCQKTSSRRPVPKCACLRWNKNFTYGTLIINLPTISCKKYASLLLLLHAEISNFTGGNSFCGEPGNSEIHMRKPSTSYKFHLTCLLNHHSDHWAKPTAYHQNDGPC